MHVGIGPGFNCPSLYAGIIAITGPFLCTVQDTISSILYLFFVFSIFWASSLSDGRVRFLLLSRLVSTCSSEEKALESSPSTGLVSSL
jgi:hypothetical protein